MGCPVSHARELWRAYDRAGIDGLRELVPDDAIWRPWGPEGTELCGLDEVGAFLGDGGARAATAFEWEAHGHCALARGSLRIFRDGGFVDVQPSWVWFFRDERLVLAESFASRDAALARIAELESSV